MVDLAGRNSRPIAILGRGGHAKVVLDLLREVGAEVVGWVGDARGIAMGDEPMEWRGLPHLGNDEDVAAMSPDRLGLAAGIGGGPERERLFARFTALGFTFPALHHPYSWISQSVQLEPGSQVMAGTVVQADCVIGPVTILNTGARIDHDCRIGRACHLAPSSTVCGGVIVGDGALIGAGAVVLPGAHVGAGAVVGAGAAVKSPVMPGAHVAGVPARDAN
jgi:UDP-perosamine 4-acetyltransferase